MIPRVETVQYKGDYIVHLRFADESEGEVDFSDELHSELFEMLKDKRFRLGGFLNYYYRDAA